MYQIELCRICRTKVVLNRFIHLVYYIIRPRVGEERTSRYVSLNMRLPSMFDYAHAQLDTDWIHPWIGSICGRNCMDWTGLGQMTANCLESEIFETQSWTGQTDCILAFSVNRYIFFARRHAPRTIFTFPPQWPWPLTFWPRIALPVTSDVFNLSSKFERRVVFYFCVNSGHGTDGRKGCINV